jgi:small-conductance mechanosensitive channel
LIAVAIALAVFLFLGLVRRVAVRRLATAAARTANTVDDLVADLARRIRLGFLLLAAIWIGSLALALPPGTARALGTAITVAVLIQAGLLGNGLIDHWIGRRMQRELEVDAGAATTVNALGYVGRVALWAIVLLLVLDNIPGVEVGTLVASLGIGGIAIALAVQNILGDLFASLSIALDKPFVIGDFIIVGDLPGTVEKVGLKTTRVRSLHGEQIIFSNSDLLNSRIRNFKRMVERRIVFSVGVTYQTPSHQLQAIPEMIRQAIEARDPVRFDRCHFKTFGDSAIVFEAVYNVLSPDHNQYMDIQQAINLDLVRRFEAEGIEFAYPTRTVHLVEPVRAT